MEFFVYLKTNDSKSVAWPRVYVETFYQKQDAQIEAVPSVWSKFSEAPGTDVNRAGRLRVEFT